MQHRNAGFIHLPLPFYRQHYDFTCGPACLMMAMKYLDDTLVLSKDMEIDIWREANLVAVPGTSRYGLAFSAATRGFSARVASNTGGLDYADKFVPPLDDEAMQVLMEQFSERRARCKKLGVHERKEPVTGKILGESLFSNHVPLIVTNASFHSDEDLPHWVAVTGIDDKFCTSTIPLIRTPGKEKSKLPLSRNLSGTMAISPWSRSGENNCLSLPRSGHYLCG